MDPQITRVSKMKTIDEKTKNSFEFHNRVISIVGLYIVHTISDNEKAIKSTSLINTRKPKKSIRFLQENIHANRLKRLYQKLEFRTINFRFG